MSKTGTGNSQSAHIIMCDYNILTVIIRNINSWEKLGKQTIKKDL